MIPCCSFPSLSLDIVDERVLTAKSPISWAGYVLPESSHKLRVWLGLRRCQAADATSILAYGCVDPGIECLMRIVRE